MSLDLSQTERVFAAREKKRAKHRIPSGLCHKIRKHWERVNRSHPTPETVQSGVEEEEQRDVHIRRRGGKDERVLYPITKP